MTEKFNHLLSVSIVVLGIWIFPIPSKENIESSLLLIPESTCFSPGKSLSWLLSRHLKLKRFGSPTRHFSKCMADMSQFFKDRPPPSLQGADYNVVRGFMKMVDEANSKVPPPPGVTEIYYDIAMRDGFTSNIKVHKPSQGSPGPLIVLAFGGAFMAGSNEQLSKTARKLSRFIITWRFSTYSVLSRSPRQTLRCYRRQHQLSSVS